MLRFILQSRHESQYHSMKARNQVHTQRQVVVLIDIQQPGTHRHGGVAQEGEQPAAVHQEVCRQTLRSDPLENGLVDIEHFNMDAPGQVRVETLRESLANCQLVRYGRILPVSQQHLGGRERLVPVKVSTKWKIYTETCMFLCFHVLNVQVSTKHVCFHVFSA